MQKDHTTKPHTGNIEQPKLEDHPGGSSTNLSSSESLLLKYHEQGMFKEPMPKGCAQHSQTLKNMLEKP